MTPKRPVKIVFISDVHLDKETMGISRFGEAREALDEAARHAVSISADAFVFGGDLCDPDAGGATFAAIQEACRVALWLGHNGVKSVWVRGNHDVENGGSNYSTLSPLAAIEEEHAANEHVYVAERPRLLYIGDDVAVACFPYAPVSHSYDPEEAARTMFAEAAPYRVITVSHLTLPGIIPGEETHEMPRGRDMPFPFEATRTAVARFNGHYHRRQIFDPKDGGPPIQIIGAAARFTMGEADHEPAYLVLEL